MNSSSMGLLSAVIAGLLTAGVTVVQGTWTDRWTDKRVSVELEQAAKTLEQVFPQKFGDWQLERELDSDPKELERAGAVGHISRLYRNTRTKARVSAFVVCAKPHDASGHTPDRCYPGAGFTISESEHRVAVPLDDGREAETFTATFAKQGHTLRIYWSYGIGPEGGGQATAAAERRWIAPQIARIALAGEPAVYKIYAIIDETRLSSAQSQVECENFLTQLLPVLDTEVVAAKDSDAQVGSEQAVAAEASAT